jgi:hypothetical protein
MFLSPIVSVREMDSDYEATKLHFENLRARYGNPIIILNLIKVSLPSYSGVVASFHYIGA